MIQQKIFNFDFKEDYSSENFIVSHSNIEACTKVLDKNASLNSS